MRPLSRLVCAAMALAGMALAADGDPRGRHAADITGLKIVVRQQFHLEGTSPRTTTTTTSYVAADRKRDEWSARPAPDVAVGPRSALITRCDLEQLLWLNLDDREYTVSPLPSAFYRRAAASQNHPPPVAHREPTLLIEKTTVDTSERKVIFGYEARHVITTQKHTPLAADVSDNQETVTDGWYVDLDTTLPCDVRLRADGVGYVTVADWGRLVAGGSNLPPVPVVSVKIAGKPETGFMVASIVTSRSHGVLPDGTRDEVASVLEMEVTEITRGHLDPALFEVPASFHDVSPGTVWYYWKNAREWIHYTIARILG